MDPVHDAVLVAAGLGTRMFPVSASLPKEALPLVDVPLLTHLVLEAKAAGIRRLHVVTSEHKSFQPLLEDRSYHHRHRPEMDAELFHATLGMEVLVHHQREPKGVGDAIGCALHAVDGPFLVMLGDNLLMDTHAPVAEYRPSLASKALVEAHGQFGGAVVGLMEVGETEVQQYGMVAMDGHRITAVVEKPEPKNSPSRWALCGRYVFPAETGELLRRFSYEEHGDLQSIALQHHWMGEGKLFGVRLTDTQWYDSGSPLLWLQAQVDHALRRSEYAQTLRTWLDDRLHHQR